MDKYLDKEIYKKAKAKVDKDFKKHSAYKSMTLIKIYKELGGRLKETKKSGGVKKWNSEKWLNLTPYALGNVANVKDSPPCGKKGKNQGKAPSICRPSKRINKTTPEPLVKELNKKQIKKALDIKKRGGRIMWKTL